MTTPTRCDRISFVNPRARCDRKAESNGRCSKHNEPLHQNKPRYDSYHHKETNS